MPDIEQQIRERAYSLWESEGGLDGRHDHHWQQAEQEITGRLNNAPPSDLSLVLEDESDKTGVPPARSGQAEEVEAPVESGDASNPVHHEGHLPANSLTP